MNNYMNCFKMKSLQSFNFCILTFNFLIFKQFVARAMGMEGLGHAHSLMMPMILFIVPVGLNSALNHISFSVFIFLFSLKVKDIDWVFFSFFFLWFINSFFSKFLLVLFIGLHLLLLVNSDCKRLWFLINMWLNKVTFLLWALYITFLHRLVVLFFICSNLS